MAPTNAHQELHKDRTIFARPRSAPLCGVLGEHSLHKSHKPKIPAVPGIYSLLVQPGIANHADCSYLMYLGKATSLRSRFGNYLTTEKTRRPKIVRLLQMYEGNIQFCYSKVREAKLDAIEEQLYNAFVPPCNSQFSGELSRAKGAFK